MTAHMNAVWTSSAGARDQGSDGRGRVPGTPAVGPGDRELCDELGSASESCFTRSWSPGPAVASRKWGSSCTLVVSPPPAGTPASRRVTIACGSSSSGMPCNTPSNMNATGRPKSRCGPPGPAGQRCRAGPRRGRRLPGPLVRRSRACARTIGRLRAPPARLGRPALGYVVGLVADGRPLPISRNRPTAAAEAK
jgi:hypothetical protein